MSEPSQETPASDATQRNSATPDLRMRRSGQRLTAAEREAAQERFLATFAVTGNFSEAADAAGVERSTVIRWKHDNKRFAELYEVAERRADDAIRAEGFRRAIRGVPKPLVSNGRLVCYEEPDLDENGEQRRDRQGRPLYRRGEPVTVLEYSDSIWHALAKARMPEFRDKQQVEVSGTIDINTLASEADQKFNTLLAALSTQTVLGKPDAGSEG